MNTRQLEYFIAVAESNSISAAARKIHLAQPALSRQIQQLEEELGTTLIMRNRKGIELTQAGKTLYLESRELFSKVEEIKNHVVECESVLRGEVKIAICYSTLPLFLDLIRQFRESYPFVKFSISHSTVPEMVHQVQEGVIDMALCRAMNIKDNYLESFPLFKDSMCIAMHRNMDPCPGKPELSIHEIENLPFCLIDTKHYPYPSCSGALISFCESKGLKLNVVYECRDTAAAMMVAMRNVAATVMPLSLVTGYNHPDISVKYVEGLTLDSEAHLLWNQQRLLSRAAKQFLSFLNENREK